MKLTEITEPLFQYLCMLIRLSENEIEYPFEKARNNIVNLLENVEHKADNSRILGLQFNVVKLPLVYFADSLISESKINFASEWDKSRLAYEHGEMAGDHSFFTSLDEVLQGDVQSQKDCLYIFYICLGLGFTGIHKNNPKKIQQIMWKISDYLPEIPDEIPEFIIEQNLQNKKKCKLPFFIAFWKPKVFSLAIIALLLIWILSNVSLYIGTSSKAQKLFKNIKIEKLK